MFEKMECFYLVRYSNLYCLSNFISFAGRSIIDEMVAQGVKDIADFNWISQLRYYQRSGGMVCSMITTDVDYGFEYLGNTGRLVATPLTDRCFRYTISQMTVTLIILCFFIAQC